MPRIIIGFKGGYWDGKMFDSESSDANEREWALKLYHGSFKQGQKDAGFVGFAFPLLQEFLGMGLGTKEMSEAGCSGKHGYFVVEKEDKGDEIHVVVEYRASQ